MRMNRPTVIKRWSTIAFGAITTIYIIACTLYQLQLVLFPITSQLSQLDLDQQPTTVPESWMIVADYTSHVCQYHRNWNWNTRRLCNRSGQGAIRHLPWLCAVLCRVVNRLGIYLQKTVLAWAMIGCFSWWHFREQKENVFHVEMRRESSVF